MRRTRYLRDLYETAVSQVTASGEAWSEFLAFSAQIYKYSFDNALLIYLQRPDATMLATLPLWNRLGRYVTKGEKSIAVCDFDRHDRLQIQHLFDVSQTHGRNPPNTWNLENVSLSQLVDQIYPNDVNDFYSCVYEQTNIAITSYMDIMLEGFDQDVEHHFLGTLPRNGVEQQLHELLQSSIISMVYHRCRLPEEYTPDFSTIKHFNTIPLAARLGFYMNTIAREILQDIARHVKIIETKGATPMANKAELTYIEIDGILQPDLKISSPENPPIPPLGRYGRMAMNHLRNYYPHRYLTLQMQGNLMKKMSEVEQEALSKMESLTEQLLRLHPLPQTDDTLVRTRHLNQIRQIAEELIFHDIIFKPR